MAITIRWMDDATSVLLVEYGYSLETATSKAESSQAMSPSQMQMHLQQCIATVPHTVDTIIDFTHAHGAVPIQTLTHLRRAASTQPTNTGITVFISNQDTITRLIELMSRSSPALARQSTLTRNRSDALTVLNVIRRNRAQVR